MTIETIAVPRWILEHIEDTLRIQNNINNEEAEKSGETCQDRNIKESLNELRKLLKGDEITGLERLEKLQPELPKEQPQELDEVAETLYPDPNIKRYTSVFANEIWSEVEKLREAFKAGAKWMMEQLHNV